jgi:nitrogen fixation protein FixH
MTRGWLWPAGIVALLSTSAAGNIAFMVLANRDASFAVERDYYRKAVEWDRTMAQRAANAELGWQASARFEPAADGGARLVVRLRDRAGAPIDGATVEVEAFANARARDVHALVLHPLGGGAYGARLAAPRSGVWEVRVAAMRNGHRFAQVLSDELPRASPITATAEAPERRGSRIR